MADNFIFADEAGCFRFHKKKGASKYFMLCTVAMDNCSISSELLDIKRRLVAAGETKRNKLHATTDSVPVRRKVYEILSGHDMRIDCTILEKTKAQPQTRTDEPTFYKYAWFYHFKGCRATSLPPGQKSAHHGRIYRQQENARCVYEQCEQRRAADYSTGTMGGFIYRVIARPVSLGS